jgi:hypothetical protein
MRLYCKLKNVYFQKTITREISNIRKWKISITIAIDKLREMENKYYSDG